jgi:hypothetical protein
LLRLIEKSYWKEADRFVVEDKILKQVIGFDPEVFYIYAI